MLNMATLLSESAKKYPNKACLVINDVTLTYGQVDMFARMLAELRAAQQTVYSPDRGVDDGTACKKALGDYGGYWGPFLFP